MKQKILIVNIDSVIPNLALAKVERYHRDRGDKIFYDHPIFSPQADKIYVSCVFRKNSSRAIMWSLDPRALVGGSGLPDVSNRLPAEIDRVKPHINLGFTTRGCIRHCPFCIVHDKEGPIRIEGDLLDLWDGQARKITLLDNNILALPSHFKLICRQARENKIRIDFNQGLDIRLVNDENIPDMVKVKHRRLRFAWDNMADEKVVRAGLKLVSRYTAPSNIQVYVLVGFNTTFEQDMYRILELRALGVDAFVMKFHKNSRLLNEMASWNNKHNLRNVPFRDYLKSRGYEKLLIERI